MIVLGNSTYKFKGWIIKPHADGWEMTKDSQVQVCRTLELAQERIIELQTA